MGRRTYLDRPLHLCKGYLESFDIGLQVCKPTKELEWHFVEFVCIRKPELGAIGLQQSLHWPRMGN
jgi:hypothetical protein